jgi:plasmid stability protein
MAQLTIRADDALVRRVKASASELGRSMNDYVTAILDAATNPELAGTDADRLRERLARAGLLVVPSRLSVGRPSSAAVDAAGRRAAVGRPLAEFVSDGR